MCNASSKLLYADHVKVPVIYLVEPTAENLQTITSDLSRGLYSRRLYYALLSLWFLWRTPHSAIASLSSRAAST